MAFLSLALFSVFFALILSIFSLERVKQSHSALASETCVLANTWGSEKKKDEEMTVSGLADSHYIAGDIL